MYLDYLNKLAKIRRATSSKDAIGAVVETFTVSDFTPARIRNLSGNEQKYLERHTTEDFERIYFDNMADVQALDFAAIYEPDGTTLIGVYEIRRVLNPEQTQNLHHIEVDAVYYGVDLAQSESGVGFPYTFPITLASSELWTFADITTEGWWDAGGKSIVIESTGGVSYVEDLSGNDQNFTQPTDIARPATGTHTLNGLNMFFMNGTEALATYGDDFVVPASGNFTVFQIGEAFLPLNNVADGMFSMLNAAGRDWQYVGGVNVNDWNGRAVVSELGGTNMNFSPPAGVGPTLYCLEFNFDASTITGYVAGSNVGDTTYTLKVTSPQTFITMSNRVGNALAGHWGECAIIEDVTEATRQRAEGYMLWRWGLQSQLPLGHPWKDQAPYTV